MRDAIRPAARPYSPDRNRNDKVAIASGAHFVTCPTGPASAAMRQNRCWTAFNDKQVILPGLPRRPPAERPGRDAVTAVPVVILRSGDRPWITECIPGIGGEISPALVSLRPQRPAEPDAPTEQRNRDEQ